MLLTSKRLLMEGKNHLIAREIQRSLWVWLALAVLRAFTEKTHALRPILLPSLIMLPIFLLFGYLSGGWKWKDFQKKYPE